MHPDWGRRARCGGYRLKGGEMVVSHGRLRPIFALRHDRHYFDSRFARQTFVILLTARFYLLFHFSPPSVYFFRRVTPLPLLVDLFASQMRAEVRRHALPRRIDEEAFKHIR